MNAAASAAAQRGGQRAADLVTQVGTSGVVDALDHVTLIAAVVAFVCGVLSLWLIRQRDFVAREATPAMEG